VKTVENHLTRLYQTLEVQSRLEAANYVSHHPQILGTPGIEAAQIALPTEPEYTKSPAILVVDDNNRYRKQLLKMIGKAYPKATIYETGNIQDTLQLAKRVKIRLALIDVILGDENGIQCARQLKTTSPQSRIVLISAYPDREFHRLGLQSGAVAFLDKKNLDLPAIKQVIGDVMI
jgi:DNA-binding NarL/FixJ family response regulator